MRQSETNDAEKFYEKINRTFDNEFPVWFLTSSMFLTEKWPMQIFGWICFPCTWFTDVFRSNAVYFQVAETELPGIYRVWILIDNGLLSVKLKVDRIFYVNRKVPLPEEKGNNCADGKEKRSQIFRKVAKILPRSKPTFHLYEYRVDEEAFIKHQNELLNDLTDPLVEGIYETQIPLMFRILCTMGSICHIKPQKRRTTGQQGSDIYLLQDIERVFSSKIEYLSATSLKPVYFYFHQSGERAL